MNITTEGWTWLGASFLAAVLLDFAIVRLLLEYARPTSVYIPWIGRAGKLISLCAWIAAFNSVLYPRFLASGQEVPPVIRSVEAGVVALAVFLAAVTLPRIGRKLREDG